MGSMGANPDGGRRSLKAPPKHQAPEGLCCAAVGGGGGISKAPSPPFGTGGRWWGRGDSHQLLTGWGEVPRTFRANVLKVPRSGTWRGAVPERQIPVPAATVRPWAGGCTLPMRGRAVNGASQPLAIAARMDEEAGIEASVSLLPLETPSFAAGRETRDNSGGSGPGLGLRNPNSWRSSRTECIESPAQSWCLPPAPDRTGKTVLPWAPPALRLHADHRKPRAAPNQPLLELQTPARVASTPFHDGSDSSGRQIELWSR